MQTPLATGGYGQPYMISGSGCPMVPDSNMMGTPPVYLTSGLGGHCAAVGCQLYMSPLTPGVMVVLR